MGIGSVRRRLRSADRILCKPAKLRARVPMRRRAEAAGSPYQHDFLRRHRHAAARVRRRRPNDEAQPRHSTAATAAAAAERRRRGRRRAPVGHYRADPRGALRDELKRWTAASGVEAELRLQIESFWRRVKLARTAVSRPRFCTLSFSCSIINLVAFILVCARARFCWPGRFELINKPSWRLAVVGYRLF